MTLYGFGVYGAGALGLDILISHTKEILRDDNVPCNPLLHALLLAVSSRVTASCSNRENQSS